MVVRNGRRPSARVVNGEPPAQFKEQLRERDLTIEHLAESIAELQLAADDLGWTRFGLTYAQEFTPDGLKRISATCRLMSIASPLIVRGLSLKTAYVHGSGVLISARATGKNREVPDEQDVNAVVQAFLGDEGNRRALTDASAQQRNERSLFTDGNVFVSLWTKPISGGVSARILPYDEITDVICNPQDSSEPWFYKRTWNESAVNYGTGTPQTTQRTVFYPALGYNPRGRGARPVSIGGHPVQWDAPVRHVKVNDEQGWKFGIGDAYPALDWARAYKEFLEAWATLVKSLSRFAWRLTAKGSQKAQAKTRLAAAPARDPLTGGAQDVGATAITPTDQILEAIPKSGATIDSESGRPLAMMVAAALGLPVTMLLGDPGLTGSRATAETLDRPTELVMQQRREVWTEALRDILRHVIAEAVRAPRGPLQGTISRDAETDREVVTLDGDTVDTVEVAWPPLEQTNIAEMTQALKTASDTGTVPPEIVLRWLLTALGERNVDEIIDRLTDDESGEFVWPAGPPLGGSQAAALARVGGDPASAGPGLMVPDEPDDEASVEEP